MNPNDLGDHIDVEFDAYCDADRFDQTGQSICGFEGMLDVEVWIPRFGDDTNVQWVCPVCSASHESFVMVGDLRW
jgi:hypothetical protein